MADDRLAVYFLDVGQGDCTFVIPPKGEGDPILFDCNDQYVAERFVSNHGISHLHAVIASHLDRDHIRGIVPFLRNHFDAGKTVRRLVVGVDRPPSGTEKSEIAVLLDHALMWAAKPPCAGFSVADPTRHPDSSLVIADGPGWSVDLVLPFYVDRLRATGMGGEDPNLCSAVLRIRRNGMCILVGGDAPLESWEKLDAAELRARAIRTPHHAGRLEPATNFRTYSDLYDVVMPNFAFVSVGSNNAYEHPLGEHIQAARLPSRSCRVRCTQLTPRCHNNPLHLRDEALRISSGVTWPYRHKARPGDPRRAPTEEVPCAGSMVIWLDPSGNLEVHPPAGGDHDAFIGRTGHPLCDT